MKAAVFHGTGQPVTVEEWPTPEPGPTELLIRVAACGVCHTDLHYLDHGTPTFKAPPLVLGHEISGVVEEVGIKAVGFELGDRVLIAAVLSCGTCEACRTGRENICQNSVMLGNNVDGGFAEFVTAPAKDVFHLPDEIPLIEGSVIADAVTTPYHAVVNRGRITPGDQVVVIGCGGVGLNVVQMATAVGAEVVAVDTSADKRDWALRLGASAAIDPSAVERLDREVRRLTGGGAHVAFEVVGKAATQQQAVSCVRTGGRVVFVGYSPEKMSLNSGRIMFRELEIVGSLGCRPVDYPRAIELVRQGRVQVEPLVTHRHSLDEIGAAFDAARAGTGVRGVVIP